MESRRIQGWRARHEEERQLARQDVWGSFAAVVFDDDHEPVNALKLRYGDKLKRRIKRFEDQKHASKRLTDLVNRDRRIEYSERTSEKRMLDKEKKAAYWAGLADDSKAAQIRRMVAYNKIWRADNRDKVNDYARKYYQRDRDQLIIKKREVYANKPIEKAEFDKLVASIYQQLLRLAGFVKPYTPEQLAAKREYARRRMESRKLQGGVGVVDPDV